MGMTSALVEKNIKTLKYFFGPTPFKRETFNIIKLFFSDDDYDVAMKRVR